MISQAEALIYTMVLVSAADSDMTDAELSAMGRMVKSLPAFKGFATDQLPEVTQACAAYLDDETGLDRVISMIRDSLSPRLRETAYALACDIVACDGAAHQEELRLLEILRHELELDRLIAAAIERGARARFTPV